MKRREFIAATVISAMLPLTARAQSQASLPRIVMYSATEPLSSMYESSYNRYIRALFAEMRRLGLVESKSLKIERYGRETPDVRSKATIAAIVDSKPNLIFVVGEGAVFKQATNTIPIVAFAADQFGRGWSSRSRVPAAISLVSPSILRLPSTASGLRSCARCFPP